MDYKEYKQMVIKSEVGSLTDYPKVLHAMMGMNGEAGECIDILKKVMFQGHELDVDHLLNELGDVCWYTMLFINEIGLDEDFVFEYIDRIVDVEQYKKRPTDLGLDHMMHLNLCCAKVIDIYYNSFGTPTRQVLETVRNIFYNVKMAANTFDRSLEDIFDINSRKIASRYPNGFEPAMSINRGDNL